MKTNRLIVALLFASRRSLPLSRTAGEPPHSSVTVFQTAKDTPDRLALKPSVEFGTVPADAYMDNRLVSVLVDPEKTYQTMEGFGGAFTESAAVTFAKLSPAKRKEILTAYFDPKNGIGYMFCRTHINSCDFSTGNYAYDETPGDYSLKHFSIDRDRKALIPLIKEAMKTAGGPDQDLRVPLEPSGVDENQRPDEPRRQAQARMPGGVGHVFLQVHPGVREGRHSDLGDHGAERARSHADLGFMRVHARRGARFRPRLSRAGAGKGKTVPCGRDRVRPQPQPDFRMGEVHIRRSRRLEIRLGNRIPLVRGR